MVSNRCSVASEASSKAAVKEQIMQVAEAFTPSGAHNSKCGSTAASIQHGQGTCMFQQLILIGGSTATAELLQQVLLLNGQALIEAVHNPTVSPKTHAGLDICMLLAQLTCRLCV